MATNPVAVTTNSAEEVEILYKFTKMLVYKLAQVIVQSRRGHKVTIESNAESRAKKSKKEDDVTLSTSPDKDWFNLSIPDEPDIKCDTQRVITGEVTQTLARTLCIEVYLNTSDGDDMVLEYWTVKMGPDCDPACSASVIYCRMGVILRSVLSISRITPAYKLSRLQHNESYKVYHRFYIGMPNLSLLGGHYKSVKITELRTSIGTICIEIMFRTQMTLLPSSKETKEEPRTSSNTTATTVDIQTESLKKDDDGKKDLDLSKPLTAGAFVDTDEVKTLHSTLDNLLPPEPKDWVKKKVACLEASQVININYPGPSRVTASASAPASSSKPIEMPKRTNVDEEKCFSLMDFPFADGSPITDLANFYQQCMRAKPASDEWINVTAETSNSSDSLSQQLKMFEDAVPEFDSMVASMFSNSEDGSEHS